MPQIISRISVAILDVALRVTALGNLDVVEKVLMMIIPEKMRLNYNHAPERDYIKF